MTTARKARIAVQKGRTAMRFWSRVREQRFYHDDDRGCEPDSEGGPDEHARMYASQRLKLLLAARQLHVWPALLGRW